MLAVNTIYPAFMGEVNCHGIGVPCTFVRLAGCNLRCYFKTKGTLCDTPEALERKSGRSMTEVEILKTVQNLKRKVVCLTGGEPLMQDVSLLLELLSYNGFYTVIETNGSVNIDSYRYYKNVSFVIDYKSKSSGEKEKMIDKNWGLMDKDDYIKFVIDTEEDYVEAKMWMGSNLNFKGNIAFGLFWGAEVGYQQLIQMMIKDRLNHVFLNMQTHKMACLYDDFRGNAVFKKIFIPKNL